MLNLAAIAFSLDRNLEDPLFVQLCDQIRQRIASGQIMPNSQLPPSRSLAAELGVSRSTVVTAYEQLVAEGYIEGRGGSGFYVCELGGTDHVKEDSVVPPHNKPVENSIEESPLTHPGYPDARLFPYRPWARCLARSARLDPTALVASKNPFGDRSLRTAIAAYLSDWRGLNIRPEQVMITAGSIDALETCIRTLTSRGDAIGLENPGYQPLRNIAVNQGLDICWLPVGELGAEIPADSGTGNTPKMVVLTPSHQFPLGGAMPPQRRLEFQHWAGENDAWIIEDDYDCEFRYAGRPIPAMASIDASGRTIYIGTFSKVFSVSLRLGYLIMPPSLFSSFKQTLAQFSVKAALPCQPALANFIESGDFYRHIRRVRRIYAERRRVLLEQVQQKLPDFISFQDHQAGMLIAFKLPDDIDDQAIAATALEQDLLVSPLTPYYGAGRAQSGLLIGFCPYTEAEITRNIDILASILQS